MTDRASRWPQLEFVRARLNEDEQAAREGDRIDVTNYGRRAAFGARRDDDTAAAY